MRRRPLKVPFPCASDPLSRGLMLLVSMILTHGDLEEECSFESRVLV